MARGGFSAVQRAEFIGDISLTATNTQYMLPTNGGLIPNDRYLYGLILQFEGRCTNAASNNPSGVQGDGVTALIDNLQVQGYHRVRGANEQFINVRGPDLQKLVRMYTGQVPFINPSSGSPIFAENLSQSANGTNDIRFQLFVPFTPLMIPVNQQLGYLLDAPNYDQLKLQVTFADDQSIFTYGTRTAGTFSAYGSSSGNPRIRVHGLFCLGGASIYGYVPARVWRYYVENTAGDITSASVTNSRQYNIPRGNFVRSILVKTGTKSTAVNAGNNVYNTLSDTIFTNIKVFRGLNKQIRYYTDSFAMQNEIAQAYGLYPPSGYSLIDWVLHGRLAEVLDTRGLVAGPSGDTDLYVQADIAGGANKASLFLIEEIRNKPSRVG